MIIRGVSKIFHASSDFLSERPFLRWFVVPILFMGGVIAVTALLLSSLTVGEIAQVVGLYTAFCLAWVVSGLAVERAIRMCYSRIAG
jgi:hypothetical protein